MYVGVFIICVFGGSYFGVWGKYNGGGIWHIDRIKKPNSHNNNGGVAINTWVVVAIF
jgi:hypothetical protein